MRSLAIAITIASGAAGPARAAPADAGPGAAASQATASPPAPKPATAPAGDEIQLIQLAAQPVITRTVHVTQTELATALPSAIMALIGGAARNGLEITGPPFARYLSRGDRHDPRLVVEAGLPVKPAPSGALRGGIAGGVLPAGPAVMIVHRGRHDQLGVAHAALDTWLSAHHRGAGGPRQEVYLTNPILTPDPDAQETRVIAPLADEPVAR